MKLAHEVAYDADLVTDQFKLTTDGERHMTKSYWDHLMASGEVEKCIFRLNQGSEDIRSGSTRWSDLQNDPDAATIREDVDTANIIETSKL